MWDNRPACKPGLLALLSNFGFCTRPLLTANAVTVDTTCRHRFKSIMRTSELSLARLVFGLQVISREQFIKGTAILQVNKCRNGAIPAWWLSSHMTSQQSYGIDDKDPVSEEHETEC